MAKIKTIADLSIKGNDKSIQIQQGTSIEVSESMAIYLCNEDIELMAISEQRLHGRIKKAIRTPQLEINNVHLNYTFI